MAGRRILLLILSATVGVGSLFLLTAGLNAVYDANVTVASLGAVYNLFIALPIGVAAGVPLDILLRTNILPE